MLHVPLSRRHNVDVENPTSTLDETLHTYIEDNKQEILRNTRYTWFGIITYVYGGKGTILLLDSRLRKVYLTSKLSSLSTKLLVFSSLTEFHPPPPPPILQCESWYIFLATLLGYHVMLLPICRLELGEVISRCASAQC